jgi:hypothetical protein
MVNPGIVVVADARPAMVNFSLPDQRFRRFSEGPESAFTHY